MVRNIAVIANELPLARRLAIESAPYCEISWLNYWEYNCPSRSVRKGQYEISDCGCNEHDHSIRGASDGRFAGGAAGNGSNHECGHCQSRTRDQSTVVARRRQAGC